jgi:DNA-3-methyladenine glycosylase II
MTDSNSELLLHIHQAEAGLSELDPKLGELIELQKPVIYEPRTDYFGALCRSIAGQQVSVASAAAVFARLDSATGLDPVQVVRLSDEEARAIGLSRQKAGYVRDLAAHFERDPGVYNHLDKRTDEQIIEELTAVKGIGRWTAQMFLMFTLIRLDVFAPDDIGLHRAMKQLYGWDKVPDKKGLEAFADSWRPYRTVACWHLWKSLHNTPD